MGRGAEASTSSRCRTGSSPTRLGILDLEAGATLAGARFFVLKGAGAMLQRALLNFMLDLHVGEQGYTEVHTPYMVREEIMYGSGQLPKFYDNLYHDAEEDLWLIPTSEVPLVNLYYDQIIPPGDAAAEDDGAVAVLPQGARGGGARRARDQARQAVLQGGDGARGRAGGLDASISKSW